MNGKNEQVKGKFHEVEGKLTGNIGLQIKGEAEQQMERCAKRRKRLRRQFEFVSDD